MAGACGHVKLAALCCQWVRIETAKAHPRKLAFGRELAGGFARDFDGLYVTASATHVKMLMPVLVNRCEGIRTISKNNHSSRRSTATTGPELNPFILGNQRQVRPCGVVFGSCRNEGLRRVVHINGRPSLSCMRAFS